MTNNIIVLEEDLFEKDIDDKNMMSWITTNHTVERVIMEYQIFKHYVFFLYFPPKIKKVGFIHSGCLGLAGGQNSTNIILF